jgi:mannose-6-phosphate isomerase-like protein (cupin superfamily)
MARAYVTNIEEATKSNTDYRRVLFTARYTQLVLMCVQPGDEIGNEVHGLDQFLRIEEGTAKVVLDDGTEEHQLKEDDAIIIPAGTWHNVVNNGDAPLKLYTLYSPPEHKDGVLQPTKADEEEEHYDGKTTLGY